MEVLLVIAVIGLLSAASTFMITNVQARARDAKRSADTDQLKKALDLYINQSGNAYPISTTAVCLDGTDIVNTALTGANLIANPITDPVFNTTPNCIRYVTDADGANYTIQYYLETGSIDTPGFHTIP